MEGKGIAEKDVTTPVVASSTIANPPPASDPLPAVAASAAPVSNSWFQSLWKGWSFSSELPSTPAPAPTTAPMPTPAVVGTPMTIDVSAVNASLNTNTPTAEKRLPTLNLVPESEQFPYVYPTWSSLEMIEPLSSQTQPVVAVVEQQVVDKQVVDQPVPRDEKSDAKSAPNLDLQCKAQEVGPWNAENPELTAMKHECADLTRKNLELQRELRHLQMVHAQHKEKYETHRLKLLKEKTKSHNVLDDLKTENVHQKREINRLRDKLMQSMTARERKAFKKESEI